VIQIFSSLMVFSPIAHRRECGGLVVMVIPVVDSAVDRR
jgi:hypothetical protein